MSVLQDNNGKLSAMRLGLFACLTLGGLAVLSGVVGFFFKIDGAVELVSTGALLMGSSGFAKAWQARYEKK